MTDDRHSENRQLTNQQRVVEMIYKLCFGRSQKCNHFQKANGFYLNFILHLAINTERRLGTAVSSRTVKNEVLKLTKRSRDVVDEAILEAMENRL